MPKKLKRCVEALKRDGISEDSAWPICIKKTGQKPHKKKNKKKK